jgi:protein-tyrosine-phosphatase
MVWIDKLKLSKQLTKVLIENGFEEPQEIQFRTLSRIAGGQDVIAIGPEGCGKTSTAVIATLNRFRHGLEGSPRVLIVAPDPERVDSIIVEFARLNKNNTIRVVPLHKGIELQTQLDDLADGADIVVATPDQARFIYLKLALNLNKIFLYVIDDADIIVKNKLQLPVKELATSIQKAQHLVFSETFDHNVEKMIQPFMKMPAFIEIEEPSFRVLMICLGNICRSPLAHGILENLIEEKGLNWEVDSAGTGDWHVGQKPDPRSISVAKKYGIDISTQRCRQFSVEDFEDFDSILVMDKQNLSDILSLAQNDSQRKKVRLFLNDDIVPDPYLDDTLFEPVYTTIEKGCHAYIKEILEDS